MGDIREELPRSPTTDHRLLELQHYMASQLLLPVRCGGTFSIWSWQQCRAIQGHELAIQLGTKEEEEEEVIYL